MNVLVDALPDAVEIDGEQIPVNTDFRACLRTILAFEDASLVPIEKHAILLSNTYPEVPENTEEAARKAVWFLNGGDDKESDEHNTPMRLFSFSKDANYIFAAFRQTHGIDLETAELHWWKFLALYGDLGADTVFCNLISIRKRLKTGKASKEEKAMARDNPDLFDVPELDAASLEEKEAQDAFYKAYKEAEKRQRDEREKQNTATKV